MDLQFKVKKLIEENDLINPGDYVLAGVSGGIDSIVLFHVLIHLSHDIGYLIAAVHINHGLRGSESDEDEIFVKSLCESKNIPFYSVRWNGPSGENIQEAARKFRYRSFLQTAQAIGAGKIALAHNLDDQAETILLNIIRGAGLGGMMGMEISRKLDGVDIIRPLLRIPRTEIETFAAACGIHFRKDATNDETKYTRNFIRHRLMPLVREINPKAPDTIAKMASILKKDEIFLNALAQEAYKEVLISKTSTTIVMDEKKFNLFDPAIRGRLLKEAYVQLNGGVHGITSDHIFHMEEIALSGRPEGMYNLAGGIVFEKKAARLAFFRK